MQTTWSSKRPTSSEFFTVDFSRQIAVGTTLSSATVTMKVISGTDANPSAMISGSAVISGANVSQKLIGGVDGVRYAATYLAVTSAGETLSFTGDFYVRKPIGG